ncbi:MAG: hypothetical protein M4579_006133 [Chaenotheca gracillima]|nr:MAG: hypothetical protein M4579_006133 [Chaenotheca gracillima]
MEHSPEKPKVAFIVPNSLIQRFREYLEKRGQLDKTGRIWTEDNGAAKVAHIPTTIPVPHGNNKEHFLQAMKLDLGEILGLTSSELESVTLDAVSEVFSRRQERMPSNGARALLGAFQRWSGIQLLEHYNEPGMQPSDPLKKVTDLAPSYIVYKPMALFAPGSFDSDLWKTFEVEDNKALQLELYKKIAEALDVTHIAVNAPIQIFIEADGGVANIQRRPTEIRPLYGDFGQVTTMDPTSEEFNRMLWVTDKHHGIAEVWAPLYTMHSRGNINEKSRLLDMLNREVAPDYPPKSTAVDLYAGIGYFAFCYAKAGMAKVLCWELNPWSVEGMRRGSRINKFKIQTFGKEQLAEKNFQLRLEAQTGSIYDKPDDQILAFEEDNMNAVARVTVLRAHIPPIRHVNCGLLPTSEPSWPLAVQIVDPIKGGWIHVHLNARDTEIVDRCEEVFRKFEVLVMEHIGTRFEARCESLSKVKSFAPSVFHYVIRIRVGSRF